MFLFILFISFALSIYLYLKIQYLIKENKDLVIDKEKLESSLNDSLSKVEDLQKKHYQNLAEISVLEKYNEELKNLSKNNIANSKEAFFEMGKSLTSQLIELQKQDHISQLKMTEKTIQMNIVEVQNKYTNLHDTLLILKQELTNSKKDVNSIYKMITNPIEAGQLVEITLQNLLSQSGLIEGIDFFLQPKIITESQELLKPDALIKLSKDTIIIVDAKSSQHKNNDNFAKNMKNHVKQLNNKKYIQHAVQMYDLDLNKSFHHIVIMFLQSESVIDQLQKIDSEFLQYSWKHNIFPVGPISLMNILFMSKFQISNYKLSENQNSVLKEINILIESICNSVEHIEKVNNSIYSLKSHTDKFHKIFNKKIITSIKKLNTLGILHDNHQFNIKEIENK